MSHFQLCPFHILKYLLENKFLKIQTMILPSEKLFQELSSEIILKTFFQFVFYRKQTNLNNVKVNQSFKLEKNFENTNKISTI